MVGTDARDRDVIDVVKPGRIVIGAAVLVAAAWAVFLSVDILGIVGWRRVDVAWRHLFNDRPVEWLQWLLLGAAILAAGYGAGRAEAPEHQRLRSFLLLLGAGLALMLFEDAGDARHTIYSYVYGLVGPEVAGINTRVISDVPYFLVIAALPIIAFVRYRRDIWQLPTARRFFLPSVVLYAMAGGGSGIRHQNLFYERLGALLDQALFGGRFPAYDEISQERAHFLLVDSVLEESIETMAAACMLAGVVAVVAVVSARPIDVGIDAAREGARDESRGS